MAMAATAPTAKFRMACELSPNREITIRPIQPGSRLCCSRLSTTILTGQGSSTSVSVAKHAQNASNNAPQWGRRRSMIFSLLDSFSFGLDFSVFSAIYFVGASFKRLCGLAGDVLAFMIL